MKSSENLEMPNFIEARSDFIEVSASTNQPSYDDNNTSELNVQQQGSKDEFVYQGIETVHTFEKMEQANNLIGGSTIATKQQESPTSKTKTHYISVEDVDDEDTRQFRDYKDYNKDHKVFAFSLPLGQNNNASNDVSPISKFKIIKPETASEEEVCKIKHKLKKSDSIDSLEELVLFSNEKGIASGRAAAIRGVIPINDLKRQVKELTIDKTDDGYSYRRLDSIWNELEGDVVIMGGYRGSKLVDTKTGKRLWIPIKAGFNMSNIDLLIGPTEKDELEAQKRIRPSGMLTHVGPVDVSRKLIRKLDSNPKVNIRDFGYDWRLSLDLSAERLKEFLTDIYAKQDEKKGVYIIAHSMGGLVAHKVLQEYTHLVRGIIYVGSPSQCPNIIGPLRFGDEVMFNKTLLSKENNFFMRSSFHFLPFDGRCFIDKNTFERYDIDFFDPKVWKKLGLSPCVSDRRKEIVEAKKKTVHKKFIKTTTTSISNVPLVHSINETTKFVVGNVPIVNKITSEFHNQSPTSKFREAKMESDDEFRISYEDSIKYLERTLKKTKKYLESLEYRPNKEYPPLAIVYGNKVPTVRGCKVDGVKSIQEGMYDDFYYGPGDGVVHYKWLLPERRGFPVVCKIPSHAGHVSLMTDLDAIAKAFISIVDAEKEHAERRKQHFMG